MLELGRAKNPNKNPVAERAIQELEEELLRQDPHGEPISPTLLAVATARLNTRIRSRGLSAREIWTHRDQFTNKQIPVADQTLILQQHAGRLENHPYSERFKAPIGSIPTPPSIDIGDLVYLYADRTKHHSRDRYLVTSVESDWCHLRKFVGSQLRQSPYRVKKSDCFKVPSSLPTQHRPPAGSYSPDSSEDEEYPKPSQLPLVLALHGSLKKLQQFLPAPLRVSTRLVQISLPRWKQLRPLVDDRRGRDIPHSGSGTL